jgi:hypothetical protein
LPNANAYGWGQPVVLPVDARIIRICRPTEAE